MSPGEGLLYFRGSVTETIEHGEHAHTVPNTVNAPQVIFPLSHCHTVTLSHCHTVTQSHCHTVTLSHYHTITLS